MMSTQLNIGACKTDVTKVSAKSKGFAFGGFPPAITSAWSSTITVPLAPMSVGYRTSGHGVLPVNDSVRRDF